MKTLISRGVQVYVNMAAAFLLDTLDISPKSSVLGLLLRPSVYLTTSFLYFYFIQIFLNPSLKIFGNRMYIK